MPLTYVICSDVSKILQLIVCLQMAKFAGKISSIFSLMFFSPHLFIYLFFCTEIKFVSYCCRNLARVLRQALPEQNW